MLGFLKAKGVGTGGSCKRGHVRTPRAELTRLQREQERHGDEPRDGIMEAMLLCAGEVGFRRVSVEQVYQRYGGYRAHFYRYFRNKSECFLSAYEWKANELADKVIALLEEEGPVDRRVNRALETVADFASEQEALAKAIFVEVHMVGREGSLKRQTVIERLARALDAACRGTQQPTPPPLTGEFMVSAIDQAVSNAIFAGRPSDFREAVPELGLLICRAYAL
jgi:AcrR family transcriptional regulator